MGFKERDAMMIMLQSVFRNKIELDDTDTKPLVLFVDCSLVEWPLISGRLNNMDAERNFLGTVDDAFMEKTLLQFHMQMLELLKVLNRPATIVYVSDSASPPMPKLGRNASYLLRKDDMQRMRDAHCFQKEEIYQLVTFRADNVFSYIMEDCRLPQQIVLKEKQPDGEIIERTMTLDSLVRDECIYTVDLCKYTQTALPYDAWRDLLAHRELSEAKMKTLYTAGEKVTLEQLAKLLSVEESRVWETLRNDTRMRRNCVDMMNDVIMRHIQSGDSEAFANTMLVGSYGKYFYQRDTYALDESQLSEADDIIMRMTHDPRFNYLIIGNDSDTAGYYFLHHVTPRSRIFWVEDWRKMHVYELSAFMQDAGISSDQLQSYFRTMVLVWMILCNNDFLYTTVCGKPNAEIVRFAQQSISAKAGGMSINELWNDPKRFAECIDAWIECQPKSTKGTFRFVIHPDGTRKKQALDQSAKPTSTGEQIFKNLDYWSKKELFLFNKTTQ
jgi:hypothetical protein